MIVEFQQQLVLGRIRGVSVVKSNTYTFPEQNIGIISLYLHHAAKRTGFPDSPADKQVRICWRFSVVPCQFVRGMGYRYAGDSFSMNGIVKLARNVNGLR